MDVERIQKINALALNLLKQGLVSDRDQAVLEAEKIFRDQDYGGDNASIRETLGKVKEETTRYMSPQKEAPVADLSSEKVSQILEQNTKFIVKRLQEFQDKVILLEKEMSDLKTKVAYQRLPTATDFVGPKSQSSQVTSGSHSEQPAPQNSGVPQNHPRSGSYKDSDVSIEKFFYMGSKSF